MKRALLIVIIVGWTCLAAGQQGYRMAVANIPFDFQVNGVTMPAGQYDFGWNDSHSIVVRATDLQSSARFATIHVVDTSFKGRDSKIVFRRLGDMYFLREIHTPGTARVLASVTSQETKYQRMLGTVAGVTVEIESQRVGN